MRKIGKWQKAERAACDFPNLAVADFPHSAITPTLLPFCLPHFTRCIILQV